MIFIDSGDIKDIKEIMAMGIASGVTTNPTILKGQNTNFGDMARLIYPLPLSIEVSTDNQIDITKQAKEYACISDNIVIKIPVCGSNGENNLGVIHYIETCEHIRVNVTACMSHQQCLVSALAGASYVSLFGGRIADMGHSACGEIARTRKLFDTQDLTTKIIAGSVREVGNITDWLMAGADIVTVRPELIRKLVLHPYTKETVQQFLRDANSGTH